MLGANITGKVYHFNGSGYTAYVQKYKFRFNPNKSKVEKTYRLRQDHIEFRLYGDIINLMSGDKIVESSSGREWTVIGIDPYGDVLGKHVEATMRMRNSDVHQQATIRKNSLTQPTYDPLLHEYTSVDILPEVDTIQYKVLIDENQKHKEQWIDQLGEGRYEHITYIMTLELDQVVNKEDTVLLPDGQIYTVDWIYTLPYQMFYGLRKSFKTTEYHV